MKQQRILECAVHTPWVANSKGQITNNIATSLLRCTGVRLQTIYLPPYSYVLEAAYKPAPEIGAPLHPRCPPVPAPAAQD